MEPKPRIRTVAPAPGCPEPEVVWIPAARPSRAFVTLATVRFSICSDLIVWAEPVKDSFLAVPYATTSTSLSDSASGSRATLTVPRSFTAISWFLYPMEENTSVLPVGTVMEYAPSISLTTPVRTEPFRTTDAAGTGSPLEASLTTPLTVTFCAESVTPMNTNKAQKNSFAFFISIDFN